MTQANDVMPGPVIESSLSLIAAGELTAQIFRRVAGNDVSTGLHGETLTKEAVATMGMTAFRQAVAAK